MSNFFDCIAFSSLFDLRSHWIYSRCLDIWLKLVFICCHCAHNKSFCIVPFLLRLYRYLYRLFVSTHVDNNPYIMAWSTDFGFHSSSHQSVSNAHLTESSWLSLTSHKINHRAIIRMRRFHITDINCVKWHVNWGLGNAFMLTVSSISVWSSLESSSRFHHLRCVLQ